MKNYVQPGDMVTFTAAAAVASGAGLLLGALFGVSAATYAVGESGELKTTGVFDLPADPADARAIGAKAYWDDTAKRVTGTASGNTLIGCFAAAKVASTPTARVRLNGTV